MEKDTRYQPLDKASISADQISRPSVSYWKDAWRRFRRDKLAVFGLVMILIVSLFAIFGPMFCPYAYDEADFLSIAQWPSKAHWFGTDALGRDLYVRVLYGARISLSIGVVAALVNMVIGVLYGGIAGYFGGKVDNVMMRIVDIIIALPSLLYTILLMMLMGSNVRSILIALCLSSWVGTARITRSQVVSLKHQEYALAAKLAGASDFQILLRHLLPERDGADHRFGDVPDSGRDLLRGVPLLSGHRYSKADGLLGFAGQRCHRHADQRAVSDVLPHRRHQPDDVLR